MITLTRLYNEKVLAGQEKIYSLVRKRGLESKMFQPRRVLKEAATVKKLLTSREVPHFSRMAEKVSSGQKPTQISFQLIDGESLQSHFLLGNKRFNAQKLTLI